MRLRDYLDPVRGWRERSDVDNVRDYTRQSMQMIIILAGLAAITESLPDDYAPMVVTIVAAAASLIALQRISSLGGKVTGSLRIPLTVLTISTVVLVVVGSSATTWWVAVIAVSPVAALVRLRWILGAAMVAIALDAARGTPAQSVIVLGVAIAFTGTTVKLSMWLLRIVSELDAARDAAAALSVAEERLRFSRDLHDVVGRALSAVAVKSELAAALARRGDDRAAAQMDEVRQLAQDSMVDARRLVRGYRSIDFASELEGAKSLLSAAGIRTEVVGAVAGIPDEAAWVVREGVTNIIRHSTATECRIEFDNNSIRIVNDAPIVATTIGDGTGLSGLRERLAAVGGVLTTNASSDTFTLSAQFSERSK